MPTPQQIEAVRRQFPAWDDATIIRHLQQRERLQQICESQHRMELARLLMGQPEVRM